MSKHTPEPWTAIDDRRGVWEIIHAGDMLAQIWRCRPGCDGDLPAEANARLIAAAPELFAVCNEALMAMGEDGANADTGHPFRSVWEKCRTVIAKAEGSKP